ncbi:unnamed protein product [Rhizophagus irregularis]|nr:unnamed protein product [Rhizophagus irregularis]CAB5355360.1 unnamed protein product [Rhizophagus irregularis]
MSDGSIEIFIKLLYILQEYNTNIHNNSIIPYFGLSEVLVTRILAAGTAIEKFCLLSWDVDKNFRAFYFKN